MLYFFGTLEPGQIKNPSKKNSVRDTAAKFLSPTIDMGAIEVAKWIARTDIPKDWKAHADTIQNCIAEWAATKDPELNLTAAMAAKMSVMFEDFTVLHQSVISSETEKQKQPRDIAIYSKRVPELICFRQYISSLNCYDFIRAAQSFGSLEWTIISCKRRVSKESRTLKMNFQTLSVPEP